VSATRDVMTTMSCEFDDGSVTCHEAQMVRQEALSLIMHRPTIREVERACSRRRPWRHWTEKIMCIPAINHCVYNSL
jgi:hypothetical protein